MQKKHFIRLSKRERELLGDVVIVPKDDAVLLEDFYNGLLNCCFGIVNSTDVFSDCNRTCGFSDQFNGNRRNSRCSLT
jgi:hypothetical protein